LLTILKLILDETLARQLEPSTISKSFDV